MMQIFINAVLKSFKNDNKISLFAIYKSFLTANIKKILEPGFLLNTYPTKHERKTHCFLESLSSL